MKKILGLLLVAAPAWAADLPPGALNLADAASIGPRCEALLKAADADVKQMSRAAPTELLLRWNALNLRFADLPTGLLAEVSPDEKIRAAAEACELKQAAFANQLLSNPALYARLKQVKPADAVEAGLLQELKDGFVANGVNLPPLQRQKARIIIAELEKLQQAFQRNLRDNKSKLAFTAEQLAGVKAEVLARQPRDAEGRYLFGFDYPEVDAIMRDAEDEAVRRSYRLAYTRRGTEANPGLLDRIVVLRTQLARMMGYRSFAAWTTAKNMVGKPAVVNGFLDDIARRVAPLEARDLAGLTAEKRLRTGNAKAELKAWDVRFYEDKILKSRYQIDEAQIRQQFPTAATLDWVLLVTSRLYGIRFAENSALPRWHEEVRGFDVFDQASQAYLGTFYLDLYPREGKYKHAAAFPMRPGSTLAGVTPISVLVTNFSRDGLNRGEIRTLFHEFGHVLHGVLSKTRYSMNAGTHVKRDFVEAPSQMYEAWALRPESLALFTEACPSCRPVPADLVARINAAEHFNKGYFYAGQRLLAAYDMALYAGQEIKAMPLWQQMESRVPLGHTPGTQFPGTFAHVAGGYAAGYYGYLWSEVIALDMLAAFGGNVMDPVVGQRYRKTILERGGEVEPMQLVRQFLGREPSSEAFIREISGAGG